MRTAATQPISGIGESSLGALVKIGQLLSGSMQSEVESISKTIQTPSPLAESTAPLVTLTTLARASRDTERVRFDYRRVGGDESERHVEPHHVVPLDSRWYLLA